MIRGVPTAEEEEEEQRQYCDWIDGDVRDEVSTVE